jgi:hypothetical protein
MIVRWWHCQHDTSSDRTLLARMLPSVIGRAGLGSWSCAHASEDTMAAFGKSCRDSGHGFLSLFDPKRSSL